MLFEPMRSLRALAAFCCAFAATVLILPAAMYGLPPSGYGVLDLVLDLPAQITALIY